MGRPKKIVNSGDVKASPEITQEVEIPNTPTVLVEGLGVGHCKLGKTYEVSRVAAVQLIAKGACKLIV
jgi:hypothetical protein